MISASMFLGIFLAALDNTIVSTLLPHIGSELNDMPNVSLVATSYVFSCAIFQPLFGKTSDVFGRKPLLISSNLLFFAGCLTCGLSKTIWWLILGRLVTGIGGGGLTSMCTIIINDIVPLRNRAVYQGFGNLFYALGTACGGLVGGLFSEYGNGWRMAFMIQLPFCFLSTISIIVYLDLSDDKQDLGRSSLYCKLRLIDWLGALTLVTFLLLFLVTMTIGGQHVPYGSLRFFLLCVAVCASGLALAYVEIFLANDPILPISFLRNKNVLGSSLANWFCMMGMMTITYYLPIYWSSVSNQGPIQVGKKSIPSFFSMALGSFGTAYYVQKNGTYYRLLMTSCLIIIFGQLQIVYITPEMPQWRQYILLAVPGFGVSILITVTLLAMIAAVPHKHQAATTSLSYAFRTTGCIIGASLAGAIFQNTLKKNVTTAVMKFLGDEHSKKELNLVIEKALRSSDWVNNGSPEFVHEALLKCYENACGQTFRFCLLCFLLTVISCSFITEINLPTTLGS